MRVQFQSAFNTPKSGTRHFASQGQFKSSQNRPFAPVQRRNFAATDIDTEALKPKLEQVVKDTGLKSLCLLYGGNDLTINAHENASPKMALLVQKLTEFEIPEVATYLSVDHLPAQDLETLLRGLPNLSEIHASSVSGDTFTISGDSKNLKKASLLGSNIGTLRVLPQSGLEALRTEYGSVFQVLDLTGAANMKTLFMPGFKGNDRDLTRIERELLLSGSGVQIDDFSDGKTIESEQLFRLLMANTGLQMRLNPDEAEHLRRYIKGERQISGMLIGFPEDAWEEAAKMIIRAQRDIPRGNLVILGMDHVLNRINPAPDNYQI